MIKKLKTSFKTTFIPTNKSLKKLNKKMHLTFKHNCFSSSVLVSRKCSLFFFVICM